MAREAQGGISGAGKTAGPEGIAGGGARVGGGSAFLLTQLGTIAARQYAESIATLDLTPPQTGLLWAISSSPGQSQQFLAERIGTPPSRLVDLLDDLERRGLVERRRGDDRRVYALHLTESGEETLRRVWGLAVEHEDRLLGSLPDADRRRLREILGRLAEEQGLTPGVHPGFASLRAPRRKRVPGS